MWFGNTLYRRLIGTVGTSSLMLLSTFCYLNPSDSWCTTATGTADPAGSSTSTTTVTTGKQTSNEPVTSTMYLEYEATHEHIWLWGHMAESDFQFSGCPVVNPKYVSKLWTWMKIMARHSTTFITVYIILYLLVVLFPMKEHPELQENKNIFLKLAPPNPWFPNPL